MERRRYTWLKTGQYIFYLPVFALSVLTCSFLTHRQHFFCGWYFGRFILFSSDEFLKFKVMFVHGIFVQCFCLLLHWESVFCSISFSYLNLELSDFSSILQENDRWWFPLCGLKNYTSVFILKAFLFFLMINFKSCSFSKSFLLKT